MWLVTKLLSGAVCIWAHLYLSVAIGWSWVIDVSNLWLVIVHHIHRRMDTQNVLCSETLILGSFSSFSFVSQKINTYKNMNIIQIEDKLRFKFRMNIAFLCQSQLWCCLRSEAVWLLEEQVWIHLWAWIVVCCVVACVGSSFCNKPVTYWHLLVESYWVCVHARMCVCACMRACYRPQQLGGLGSSKAVSLQKKPFFFNQSENCLCDSDTTFLWGFSWFKI
jgi:hypothetical protein